MKRKRKRTKRKKKEKEKEKGRGGRGREKILKEAVDLCEGEAGVGRSDQRR